MTAFRQTNIRILAILFLISCQSCQFLERKKLKDKLLQKELKAINWKQVDEFPMIADCEKLDKYEDQKQCFFEFLSADIKNRIRNKIQKNALPHDTIFIAVTVDTNSKVIFKTQKDAVLQKIANSIDSILKIDTLDFPKIKPALKRGIVVKSEFILPIIL